MIINIQIIFLLNLISAGTSTLNDDDVPEDLQSNSNYSWINRAKSSFKVLVPALIKFNKKVICTLIIMSLQW